MILQLESEAIDTGHRFLLMNKINNRRLKNALEEKALADMHMHTHFSDGANDILEMCEKAISNGLRHIAITDHIRMEPGYLFGEYLAAIDEARCAFPDLNIITGCEAKILENGRLNVSPSDAAKCDIVLGSFHSPLPEPELYFEMNEDLINEPMTTIWAHPTIVYPSGFEEKFIDLFVLAREKGVIIEVSERYRMPSKIALLLRSSGAEFVFSSDAHSADEIRTPGEIDF